jgi:hypothetical protein
LARPALVRVWVTSALTVGTLISRDDAISALVWPSAMARTTSSSRGDGLDQRDVPAVENDLDLMGSALARP